MQWRARRFFCVNGHGLFFGNGGAGERCPLPLPHSHGKNRWVSLCASLQSRQGDGEHEKVKGDEARINVPKTGPKFEKTERTPRRGGCPVRVREQIICVISNQSPLSIQ